MARSLSAPFAHSGVWSIVLRWMVAALVSAGLDSPTARADSSAPTRPHGASALLVFAAASLGDALSQVDADFTARTGIEVKASFAASALLARQIEAGAPADVFFSADEEWMDYLEQRALLRGGSRRDLLGNALVLVAPRGSAVQLHIAPGFNLAAALGDGRLAMADPDSVPAGRYARAALTKLGVWPQISAKLVAAENVRAALEYVARGEAPLGIVYRTDAQAEPRVRTVDLFPADSHPPITYPVALTAGASPFAARYAAFLASEEASAIFKRSGFVLPVANDRAQ